MNMIASDHVINRQRRNETNTIDTRFEFLRNVQPAWRSIFGFCDVILKLCIIDGLEDTPLLRVIIAGH